MTSRSGCPGARVVVGGGAVVPGVVVLGVVVLGVVGLVVVGPPPGVVGTAVEGVGAVVVVDDPLPVWRFLRFRRGEFSVAGESVGSASLAAAIVAFGATGSPLETNESGTAGAQAVATSAVTTTARRSLADFELATDTPQPAQLQRSLHSRYIYGALV